VFNNTAPRKILLKYPGQCQTCNQVVEASAEGYFLHKTNSPSGKSQIWHTDCYELTKGGAGQASQGGSAGTAAQGSQGSTSPNSASQAQGGGNSADPGQGANGGQGSMSQEPPKASDLVCQLLFDEEKLVRHLHREDLWHVLKNAYRPYDASQLPKADMARLIVKKSDEQVQIETERGREPFKLLHADNLLREMLKLPKRPDPNTDPEALKQQMEQQAQQMQQAMEEAAEAMKMAEEAEAKAEEAEGKIVEIKTPEGQTINLTDRHFKFSELAMLVAGGVNVMIVGPAGGGKTEAARALAKDLGQEFMPLSLGPQTTQASLFGYTDAQGQYVRTPFREAFENGGLILLDEFDRCNERVSVTLNAAIAQRYCAFPDGTIQAHEKTIFLAAANTVGHGADRQYVSARQQDAATLDRFAVLDWPYDEHFETVLTLAQGLDEDAAHAWLNEVRKTRRVVGELALRYLVSPRTSIQGAKLMASGAPKKLAEDALLYRGWKPEDRQKVENNA
jgi:MoxR-like ATPase